jgi:hypothetical protein
VLAHRMLALQKVCIHQLICMLCCHKHHNETTFLKHRARPANQLTQILFAMLSCAAGSAPPGVPMFTPFIWRDEASGSQLLAFWRPGMCKLTSPSVQSKQAASPDPRYVTHTCIRPQVKAAATHPTR